MSTTRSAALAATSALRSNPSVRSLPRDKQRELEQSLQRIERALGYDPYLEAMGTPLDLQRAFTGEGDARQSAQSPAQGATPSAPARRQATETIGARIADTLDAVDFSGFVAGLVTGTFQAIVDATVKQLHEYAELIASLAKSVDEFARDNVTVGQARQRLIDRHRSDLRAIVPGPGEAGDVRIVPAPGAENTSPSWLAEYGLQDEQLTEELTNGPLVEASKKGAAEERMQMLSTMVLMGINRIVVNQGQITAKLQFHAVATDRTEANVANIGMQQQAGIAGRTSSGAAVSAQVSTVKANVQADAGIKTNLMGEVRIQFASETFPLERFADSGLIDTIRRHAHWRESATPASSSPVPASSQPVAENATPV